MKYVTFINYTCALPCVYMCVHIEIDWRRVYHDPVCNSNIGTEIQAWSGCLWRCLTKVKSRKIPLEIEILHQLTFSSLSFIMHQSLPSP